MNFIGIFLVFDLVAILFFSFHHLLSSFPVPFCTTLQAASSKQHQEVSNSSSKNE